MHRRGVGLLVAGAVVLGACANDEPVDDTTSSETAPQTGTEPVTGPEAEPEAEVEGPVVEADPDARPDMQPPGPPSDEIGVPVAIDPVLSEGDGVGYLWVHPLPQTGEQPLTLAVTWPAHGLDEQVELDVADDLVETSERVAILWE